MKTLTLNFPDMCCPAEFSPFEAAVLKADERFRLIPDYGARTVRILFPENAKLDEAAVLQTAEKLGLAFKRIDEVVTETVRIRIPEMDCPVEAGEIERELKKAGLEGYAFDIMNRELILPADHEIVLKSIEAVKAAGYEPDLGAEAAPSGNVRLSVPEMDCPVEEGEIDREFKKAGLSDYSFDVMNRTVTVKAADLEKAESAIKAAGFESSRLDDMKVSGPKTLLSVPEMDCPVEAGEIEREFRKAGISGYELNIMNRTIAVPSALADAAKKAIEAAGYESTVMVQRRREADFEDKTVI